MPTNNMNNPKFRAWDDKKKCFAFDGFHLIGEVTTFDLLKQYSIENFNDLKTMQYLGVNDSKGKELCEGDIVRHRWMNGDWSYGVVGYWFGEYVFCNVTSFVENKNKMPDDRSVGNCWYSPVTTLLRSNPTPTVEIIGNIFENPNLARRLSARLRKKWGF
jgi:uncharacterized phage protein (TIGR01671 family)